MVGGSAHGRIGGIRRMMSGLADAGLPQCFIIIPEGDI